MPFLLVLLAAGVFFCQPAHAQQDLLAEAEAAQAEGKIDEAIALNRRAGVDQSMAPERRQAALLQLARLLYLVKGEAAQASVAIAEAIALEPPVTPVNPDLDVYDFMRLYYKIRKETSGSDAVERGDPGIHTLAIVDFENTAVDDHDRLDPLCLWAASEVGSRLRDATDLNLVERQRLKYILEENDLQRDASRVDQATAVRAGKLLGAHLMGLGSVFYMGREVQFSLRFVKVETGELVTSVRVSGRLNEVGELMEELALKSAQALNVVLDKTAVGKRSEVNSLDAILAYSEGTRFEEDKLYVEAYAKYLEALEFDPNYVVARRKLEALRSMGLIAENSGG